MSYKQLCLNKKSSIDSIDEFDNEILFVFDEHCISEIETKKIQKKLLENYKHQKIYFCAKPITDALKKVDGEGYVIENLDRDGYIEVYTPLICLSGYIEDYFKEFKYWSLNKFIKLNQENVEYYIPT